MSILRTLGQCCRDLSQPSLPSLKPREIDMQKKYGKPRQMACQVRLLFPSTAWHKMLILGIVGEHLDALRTRLERAAPIVTGSATFVFVVMGGDSLIASMIVLTYLSCVTIKFMAISFFRCCGLLQLWPFFTKAKNQELLRAAPAYAAALVVFVGSLKFARSSELKHSCFSMKSWLLFSRYKSNEA